MHRHSLPERKKRRVGPASAVTVGLLAAFAVSIALAQPAPTPAAEPLARDLREEVIRIPVTVKSMHNRQETVSIPITVFRPPGESPAPLVVFNHGRDTATRQSMSRSRFEHAARYFVDKGFVVMLPTRAGYAETFGDFDPEDDGPCNAKQFAPMSTAASDQVLATVAHARSLPGVDASRWIVAGSSVGGVTSIATVGRNPPGLMAGINFAGGAGGNPKERPRRSCGAGALESYWGGIARDAAAPMLWLYWENDLYWGADAPKQWHKAWVAGGGRAEFTQFPAVGDDGHVGVGIAMDHWLPVVDAFLAKLGFDRQVVATRPPASGFADLKDAAKVPISPQSRTTAYARFLEQALPRAFAISDRGAWGFATGDYAHGKALGNCRRSGQACRLYAVDNEVVWRAP